MSDFPILLNSAGAVTHIMDTILSASWARLLTDVDDFELQLPSTSPLAAVVAPDMFVVVPEEPPIAYVIENISVRSAGAESVMSVSGRSLDKLFGNPGRIVLPTAGGYYTVTDSVEAIMKALVNNAAGATAAAERQVSVFAVAASAGTGSTATIQARYEPVIEWLQKLAEYDYMGWEVTYDPATGLHTFDVIPGVDRATEVIFDFDFDSIKDLEWIRTGAEYTNYALVVGEGVGGARLSVEGWEDVSEPTGLARRETFIDAGQVDTINALALEGDAAIQAGARQETFTITVNPFGPFQYRTHWDLGDVVTVKDERWGIEAAAKIVSVHLTIEPESLRPTVEIELGKPAPTLKRAVLQEFKRLANTKGVT